MPWLLPINAIVHQNEEAVVGVESLAVYPNGFVVNVHIQADPHVSHQAVMARVHSFGRAFPRIGVRYSDGSTGGQGAEPRRSRLDIPKDADGFPTEPFVGFSGGGGGGRGWRFGAWIYPLPPDGPVEIFISMPVAGLEEGKVEVDGGEVRAAAERARVIWR